MTLEEILSDSNWVSNRFAWEFVEAAKAATHDMDLAEKAGLASANPEVISYLEYALLKLVAFPYLFFRLLPREYAKFNRFNRLQIVRIRPGLCTFSVVPLFSSKAHPDICKNTVGVIKSIKDVFGLEFLSVRHVACVHNGDRQCIFDVQYSAYRLIAKRSAFFATICLCAWGLTGLAGFLASTKMVSFAISSLLILLAISWVIGGVVLKRYFTIKTFSQKYHDEIYDRTRALQESYKKLDKRYQEANLIKTFSIGLASSIDSDGLITKCISDLNARLGYGRILFMQLYKEQKKLVVTDYCGIVHPQLLRQFSLKFPPESNDSHLFASTLVDGKAMLITDVAKYRLALKVRNSALLAKLDVGSLVVCPLIADGLRLGLLVVGRTIEEIPLNGDDKHILENIAGQIAVLLKQKRIFESERSMRTLFSRYVPTAVLEAVDVDSGAMPLRSRMISSLFIDVRGFSALSEQLTPEETFRFLNVVLKYLSSRISRCGGVIDKFVGDGVVAFFLSPETDSSGEGHRHRLMDAVRAIVCEIHELKQALATKDLPFAPLGIGAHSGIAMIGSLGSEERLNFTAIGDAVNSASRLESLTKELCRDDLERWGVGALISTAVIRDMDTAGFCHPVGDIQLRGKENAISAVRIDCGALISLKEKTSKGAA